MKKMLMMCAVALAAVCAFAQELYCVIDLSGGTSATSYPVTYLSSAPSGGWSDTYKTTKLVLRKISAGTFTMGSPTGELGRGKDETQHQVALTKDYYMGVFQVTQRQWELVMGTRPSYFNNDNYYAPRPVEQVSYDMIRGSLAGAGWPNSSDVDTTSFLGILRAKSGLQLDLPTEAQWEYACRAGTTTALNSGKNLTSKGPDSEMDKVGRYSYNGGSGGWSSHSCDWSEGSAKVGSYAPNAWGLYDMHGNVFEWCLDWYGSYSGNATDPKGSSSGSNRVVRGGSWDRDAFICRSAPRSYNDPAYEHNYDYGLRLCCPTAEPKPEGGPYKEIVGGTTWTFMVDADMEAVVGTGSSSGTAVPTSTRGAITVPSSLGGRVVTGIGEDAFYNCISLTRVAIPSSVTDIGRKAFRYCTSLTSVTIPSSVTRIDNTAFQHCSSLTSVSIPSSVKSIGKSAFEDCTGLTSVTMQEGVTSLGENVFSSCSKLASITIPSSVISIGEAAFYNCRSLKSVTISSGVTSIGRGAFCQCVGLTSVTIPSSVTSFGEGVFYECANLNAIDFEGAPPEGVEDSQIKQNAAIRYNVAYQAQWLTVIQQCGWTNAKPYAPEPLPEGGPYKETVGGIEWAFMVDENLNACVGAWEYGSRAVPESTAGAITIPTTLGGRTVTSIGQEAFCQCKRLTSVSIPSGVTYIGEHAFDSCSGLTSVTMPSSVTHIDEWAFHKCAKLTNMTLPSSLGDVGKAAFRETGLSNVTIPASLTYVGEDMLRDCANLTKITIPSTVTRIDKSAFENCQNLNTINLSEGLTSIGEESFEDCYKLTGVVLPGSLRSIGRQAFSDCRSLTSMTVPKDVTSIGDGPFVGCTALQFISVASDNAYFSSRDGVLFDKNGQTLIQCPGAKSGAYVIPSSVTSIGEEAFVYCKKLTRVTIPSSVINIGAAAFACCTGLPSITIPSSVTSLGEETFAECSNLNAIDFEGAPPEGVENAQIKLNAAIRYNVVYQAQWLTVILQCGWTNAKPYTPGPTPPGPKPEGGPYSEKVGGTTWTFMVDDDLEAVVGTGDPMGETAVPTSTKGAVTIPSELGGRDVAALADYAFAGCSKVTAVTIPAGVEEIGVEVFDGCSSLTAINVAAGNESYSSVDGVLFDGDMTTLIQCPGGKQGAYEVPDDVERIADYAFADCAKITDVTLTSDVTGIGAYAFMDCGMARITIPSGVRTIGEDAFLGCDDLEKVYVDEGDERRVKTLMERSGFDTDQVEFRIIGETPTFEVVAGMKVSIDVGFVGYTAKNLPKGLSFNGKTGVVTGTTKVTGTYEATFSKKGEWDETAIFEVRDEEDPEIDCPGLEEGEFTVGVAGESGGILIGITAESGVKSVSAKNLPAGMKVTQDKLTKEWYITGGPTKAGYYPVTLTVTTTAGNKADQSYVIEVTALPDMAVGTFNGFVTKQDNAERFDPVIGAIQVTATDAGKISAKVTTADKAYSFTAACWDSGKEGRYSVEMSLKTGETLTLELDTGAGWDEHQLTGSFDHKVLSGPFDVSAQRNAFGKTWSFNAEGDETDGWTLTYAENPKTADLTLTLNADGKTTLAGKLGTLKVSASGYSDVSGIADGALIADFAPVVTVNKVKTILSVHTNLWFDRSNEHEFIGSAKLMD